jgi:hypothetical protein
MKFALPLFIATLGFLFYIYYQAPLAADQPQFVMPTDTTALEDVLLPDPLDGMTETEKAQYRLQRAQAQALQAQQDSLYLSLALQDALNGAQATLELDSVATAYVFYSPDSAEQIWMDVEVGKLFDEQERWVLVRRDYSGAEEMHLNLYHVTAQNELQNVLTYVQGAMNYTSDTIFDVNADGRKDFVVQWHPSAGCCTANHHEVHLQLEQQQFSKAYSFINAVFSPQEGIIRGLEYGYFQEGDAGLYKYQWNGLQVDTLEFIYKDKTQDGNYYKTTHHLRSLTPLEKIPLDSIPEEYHAIRNY